MRRRVCVRGAALLAAAIVLGGCGGGGGETPAGDSSPAAEQATPVDHRAAVEAVVVAYMRALGDGEYETACGYLGEGALEDIGDLPGSPGDCVATMEKTFASVPEAQLEPLRNVQVTSVEVDGDTATVEVAGGRPLTLELTDDGWLIAELTL